MEKLTLPELPENYFWRVTQDNQLSNTPIVELRHRWWLFSLRVYRLTTDKVFPTVREEIEYLAETLYDKWEVETREWLALKEYLGDYHS